MEFDADVIVVGLGALGSAACWQAARRGLRVIGLEQFELGHERGASHDTSRILRHSYHTPGYVALTVDAYEDWADLEQSSGEQFVTVTGGVDLFPAHATSLGDYTSSLAALDIDFEVLDAGELAARAPAFEVPEGTRGLWQARGAIVPAARGTAAMQAQAVRHGADLRAMVTVAALEPAEDYTVVVAAGMRLTAPRVIVTADGWSDRLIEPLGTRLPLTVTQEQVTYFDIADVPRHQPGTMPVWIWTDDPSFYGFPCYGENTIKAAQDAGGPIVTPDTRTFDVDLARQSLLADFMTTILPGVGRPLRSKSCLYTMPPDRDFVLDALPNHPGIIVGLGAAHSFKFAPTFGRLLANLADGTPPGHDLTPFKLDRPGLTDPDFTPQWQV